VSSQTNNSVPITRRGAETKSLGMWNISMKVLHRQCSRGERERRQTVTWRN